MTEQLWRTRKMRIAVDERQTAEQTFKKALDIYAKIRDEAANLRK